jgi:hypothetical protein
MTQPRSFLKDNFASMDASALHARLAPWAQISSALTDTTELTTEQLARLIVAETQAPEKLSLVEHFASETQEVAIIGGELDGEVSGQFLYAAYDDAGRITELKSFFKYIYTFTLVREKVRTALTDLPQQTWHITLGPPDTGEVHENPPSFPYAPDIKFSSPVMRLPITSEPLVQKVLSHAHSLYGDRLWSSDIALAQGNSRTGIFAVEVGGQPFLMANVIRTQDGAVNELVAFGRPWDASLALYTQLKVRLSDLLSPEHFYPKQRALADYAESS